MKKKGFTLIELLAIIVILAIIAVITVPLILNIVEDAKLKSITDSAYGYKDGILNYGTYLKMLNSTSDGLKGSHTVNELRIAGLKLAGKEPTSGIVLIDDDGVSGCLQYDEYASYLYNSNVINTLKADCPTQKLVTTGDGLYKSNTDPGRLIFRGQNPNNRIFIKEDGTNNTLYRIVSYETDGTIKVVRDDKLSTDRVWDEDTNSSSGYRKNSNNTYCNVLIFGEYYGCNAWGNGSNTLHDGVPLGSDFHYFYYSSSTATTLSNGESGTVTSDSTLNTYLNNTWLPAAISNYMDDHSWNVGGIYRLSDDKGIIKEKEEERQLQWIGKVALMNITEFAEASTNPNCTSVIMNFGSSILSSNGSSCLTDNWTMYNKSYNQWTLSANPLFHSSIWYVNSEGYFGCTQPPFAQAVRPVFYLKSDLSLSGSGAEGSEYTIN